MINRREFCASCLFTYVVTTILIEFNAAKFILSRVWKIAHSTDKIKIGYLPHAYRRKPVILSKIKPITAISFRHFSSFDRIMCIHRLRILDSEQFLVSRLVVFMEYHLDETRRNNNFIKLEMFIVQIASIISVCNDTPSKI